MLTPLRAGRVLLAIMSLCCVYGLNGVSHAQTLAKESGFPPKLYKSITQGCKQEMAGKVVSPQVTNAYCFCYANTLSEWFTVKDFERMGQHGVTKHDKKRFKKARKHCKPQKPKKKR